MSQEQVDGGSPLRVGALESDLLRWVADQAHGVTARQAVEAMQATRPLARTTVATMLERLVEKGHLKKEKAANGTVIYRACESRSTIVRKQISQFVKERLQGQWAPMIATFCDEKSLNEADKKTLQEILGRLEKASSGEDQGV